MGGNSRPFSAIQGAPEIHGEVVSKKQKGREEGRDGGREEEKREKKGKEKKLFKTRIRRSLT